MTHTLAETIATVNLYFASDRRESEVCAFVFCRLQQLHEHFDSVTLGSIAADLGWAGDQARVSAIARALDYLAFGGLPLLERRFQLWPAELSGDVLETPSSEFSDFDIRNALETNSLMDPNTGELVPDFLNRVQVIYLVTPFAHGLVTQKETNS
jgi:hypothetical protein